MTFIPSWHEINISVDERLEKKKTNLEHIIKMKKDELKHAMGEMAHHCNTELKLLGSDEERMPRHTYERKARQIDKLVESIVREQSRLEGVYDLIDMNEGVGYEYVDGIVYAPGERQ